ncbi:hypothetical protein IB277_20065 [Ensifer sp. ENS07]|uniref:hypothetical protein n=1 Tax=Ensifer sp. ENS07 TaxID=2769274 RepID=UPI00178648A0|nr:hypothetical protein [Ensifer sp. ENS07]MBD9638604.1 hypothetical protein [Ensifer sp. ENS07]
MKSLVHAITPSIASEEACVQQSLSVEFDETRGTVFVIDADLVRHDFDDEEMALTFVAQGNNRAETD